MDKLQVNDRLKAEPFSIDNAKMSEPCNVPELQALQILDLEGNLVEDFDEVASLEVGERM